MIVVRLAVRPALYSLLSPFSTLTVRREVKLFRTTIQVVHGDLTEERTDAIGTEHTVNAANSELRLGMGVAGAIRTKGGPTIQEECDQWVKAHGHVAVGCTAVTGPGRLPCRYIIHAVGPRANPRGPLPEADLKRVVSSVLSSAEKLGLGSVAIPAISSGIFGYPKDKCAKAMIEVAGEYSGRKAATSLSLLRFTNIDLETVLHFESAFNSLLPPPL